MKCKRGLILGLGLSVLFIIGCEPDYPPSLFDPNEKSKPQPIISEIIPPDSSFAGVGQIIIRGQNFSPNPGENLVFFNAERAEVIKASETELVIKTPNMVADSIVIKIAVHGAELFSEPWIYKLVAAVSEFGKLLDGEIAWGIASDRQGAIYVSIEGKLIKKISPEGKTSIFTNTPFLRANAMKMGPGDTLYAVAAAGRARIIQTIAPDGSATTFTAIPGTPRDLDFDANGNIWVGTDNNVYRVKPDRSKLKAESYDGKVEAVRVFNGYLYVLETNQTTGVTKIWRSAINNDTLGAKEEVLDLTAAPWLENERALSMNFAADGTLYLGTTHPEGMFVVDANGSGEPLYPGLIPGSIYAMTWPPGQAMYVVVQQPGGSTILKINMGKDGAPYYGRK